MKSGNSPQSLKIDFWMPLYIGAYLQDTAQLSAEESGAYLHLLMEYWAHGPLRNDPIRLTRIAKLEPNAWSIAQAILSMYFVLGEDGLFHQKGADRRREAWLDKRLKAHEKAQKAARARWGKQKAKQGQKTDAPSITQAMPITGIEEQKQGLPPPSPPLKSAGGLALETHQAGAATPANSKGNKERKRTTGAQTRQNSPNDGKAGGGRVVSVVAPAKNIAGVFNAGVTSPEHRNGFDRRHERFREEVFSFWREMNPDDEECPWKGGDRALAALLADAPSMALAEFKRLLKNRALSEVNAAALPSSWLRKLKEYSSGSLDRFGKPLRGGRTL